MGERVPAATVVFLFSSRISSARALLSGAKVIVHVQRGAPQQMKVSRVLCLPPRTGYVMKKSMNNSKQNMRTRPFPSRVDTAEFVFPSRHFRSISKAAV